MGTIQSTSLATSSPLNLTRGFGFFPANTSIDSPSPPTIIGIGATPSISHSLLNTTIPLAFWRLRANVSGQFVAGVFFGYNLGYTVQGATLANGTARLEFQDDSTQGGAGFGFGFTLSFAFNIDQLRTTISFRRGIQSTWERVFNFSASATIDLIGITLQILRAAGVNVPLDQISAAGSLGASGAIWGLYSSASSQLASEGSLTFRPRLNVSVNLLSVIPQLRATLKALKKAGGKLSVGPQLNIEFPVTIEIVRLTTEDGDYNFSGFSSGVFRFNGGPAISSSAPPVQDISIVHTHTLGFRFTLEVKASFGMWSIFSLSASVPINLSSVVRPTVGVNRALGPFFTTLNNSQNLAHDESRGAALAAELPEVVWG